jgi:hypothetical protein
LFVDSSGNIGIGTATPSNRLSILSATADIGLLGTSNVYCNYLINSASIGYVGDANWMFGNSSSDFGLRATNNLVFGIGASERARIDSSGRLGLGTSAPDERLVVAGAIRATSNATDWSASNGALIDYNAGEMRIVAARNGANSSNMSFTTFNAGTAGTRMYITSAGSVGIGTTGPSQKLSVEDAADTYALVKRTVSGSESTLLIGAESGKTVIYSRDNATGGRPLEFTIGTAPAARIDSSGRLLVGTSSSAGDGLLQVRNDSGGVCYDAFRAVGTATGAPVLRLNKSRGTAASPTEVSSGDVLGYIAFAGYDGAAFADAAYITAIADGTWTDAGDTTDNPGALVFSTTADGASSPTERMKITRTGEIYVFCASGAWNHSANNGSGAGTESALYQGRYGATDNTGTTGTRSYVVWTNGNVQNTNNSYTAISDIKLKENVVDANSQWADIKSLQVRNYNLKEGQTHRQIGLIAQEVELISPGLVYESPDRDDDGNDLGTVTKSVNYSVLYMKAVKALQEAMERIETLEAKVAALESA